jgi:hypothetical protein
MTSACYQQPLNWIVKSFLIADVFSSAPRPTAVLIDELDASGFQGPAYCQVVGNGKRSLVLSKFSTFDRVESKRRFSCKVRDAFEQEINPRGIIEQMYVHDICAIVCEILRLRWCSF